MEGDSKSLGNFSHVQLKSMPAASSGGITSAALLPPMVSHGGAQGDVYMHNPFAVGEELVRENISPREV